MIIIFRRLYKEVPTDIRMLILNNDHQQKDLMQMNNAISCYNLLDAMEIVEE
jgi:hypothetical protein